MAAHSPTSNDPGRPGCVATAMGRNLLDFDLGFFDRPVNDRKDPFQMSPGGDLGYDALEGLMQLLLARDGCAQHLTIVGNDRGGRLVAGRFERKDHSSHEKPDILLECSEIA